MLIKRDCGEISPQNQRCYQRILDIRHAAHTGFPAGFPDRSDTGKAAPQKTLLLPVDVSKTVIF